MIRSFDFKLGLLKMQLYFFFSFFSLPDKGLHLKPKKPFSICAIPAYFRDPIISKYFFFSKVPNFGFEFDHRAERVKTPKIQKKKKKFAKFIVIYSSVSLRFNHFLLIRNPNFVWKFTQRSNRRDTHREAESNLLHGKYMKKKTLDPLLWLSLYCMCLCFFFLFLKCFKFCDGSRGYEERGFFIFNRK